jgi:hypothetical protein
MELKQKLYIAGYDHIGYDLSPTQSRLGCSETVSSLINLAYNAGINYAGTYELWQYLKDSPKWEECNYEVGAVIISPSRTNTNSRVVHGHVGVCGIYQIMSNNSNTGLLDTYWTRQKWEDYFGEYGGFPIYYYKRVIE